MRFYETGFETGKRNLPWEGIGEVVSEAPTSAEALRLAGLDWKVEPRKIFDETGKEIPGFIANTRDRDNKVFGIVSERYNIIQNEEAFSFTDALIGNEVKYETAGALKGGKQVWLLAKMPQTEILGDRIDPYICFTNSHDGLGAVKVCMTPIRVWCSNTLNLALKGASRMWTTRHIGNIEQKLQEARLTLIHAKDYMAELNETAEKLASKKVTEAELESIFDSIYPIKEGDSLRKINNITDMKEELFRCYNMPDIVQFKGTAWGLINAATDMAAHSTPKRLTETYRENNWGKIMTGHPLVDEIYKRVEVA